MTDKLLCYALGLIMGSMGGFYIGIVMTGKALMAKAEDAGYGEELKELLNNIAEELNE